MDGDEKSRHIKASNRCLQRALAPHRRFLFVPQRLSFGTTEKCNTNQHMSERCGQCGEDVPAGFGFCGKCGTKLGTPVPLYAKDSRERKSLENDLSEAVVDRLVKWGKVVVSLFLAAFGIAGLSIVIWGITSISDAKKSLETTIQTIKADAVKIKTQADAASAQSEELNKKYTALNANIERYRQVNQQIENLQKDLKTVHGQIENWYKSLETEIFDAHTSSDRVKFVPVTEEEEKAYGKSMFRVTITLKRVPIPASVHIIRRNLEISPNELKIEGRQVTFITFAKFGDVSATSGDPNGAPISVQCHALQ
jgi:hypothetical protein